MPNDRAIIKCQCAMIAKGATEQHPGISAVESDPLDTMRVSLAATCSRPAPTILTQLQSAAVAVVPASFSPRSQSICTDRKNSVQSSLTSNGSATSSNRLFTFGVATDVQYADLDQGFSHGGTPRYYRNALQGLKRAVQGWRDGGVDFAMHLGDIIDGKAVTHSEKALADVLREFAVLDRRVHHLLGNHCLYNFPRPELNARLDIEGVGGASYYAFSPHPDWRFLALDAYDLSMLGWPPGHPNHEAARAILDEKNPNEEKNSPEGNKGPARRFVKFGGGLSEVQLEWLEAELRDARQQGQRCLCFCHLPMHPGTCTGTTLLWNYEEVMRIVQGAGNVAACFAGHTHQNGAATDEFGIHYLALAAILETPPNSDCFGTVAVYPDRLELVGTGEMQSGVLLFPEAHQEFSRMLSVKEQADSEQQVLVRNSIDLVPASEVDLPRSGL